MNDTQKRAYLNIRLIRLLNFFESYIPADLPERQNEDEVLYLHQSKDGYRHHIEFCIKEAIKLIAERPDSKNLEHQLHKLQSGIDIWTSEWNEPVYQHICLALDLMHNLSTSDAYIDLFKLAYPPNTTHTTGAKSTSTLRTYRWLKETPFDEVSGLMAKTAHIFENNSLEALKIAFSNAPLNESNQGIIILAPKGQFELTYLIDKFLEQEIIAVAQNTLNKVYSHLTNSRGNDYSNFLSKAKNEGKLNLVDTNRINALAQKISALS